jgi:hypothetical protein
MSNDDARRAELGGNMRFYADMRFKQLTLFLAWLTLAGAGAAQYETQQLRPRSARPRIAIMFPSPSSARGARSASCGWPGRSGT